MQKRLMVISDISCIGKCSLMTASPILSAMGHECAVLPTSLLSAHTAAFPEYTFCDLSRQMEEIIAHFSKRELTFDGILTGYLTSPAQSATVEGFIDRFRTSHTPVVVDPILGDHGRLYAGFTTDHVEAAISLCGKADYILPNITEAALLLNREPPTDEHPLPVEQIRQLAKELTDLGVPRVIITGVPRDNTIGIVGYDRDNRTYLEHFTPYQAGVYHGTGDIFAAVFFGAVCNGTPWTQAAVTAVDFTETCVCTTARDGCAKPYGTNFEQCLGQLCNREGQA